jgi:hypothetical protein
LTPLLICLLWVFIGEKNNMQEKNKKEIKSAYDMTNEEVAKSVDLETSDFDESGDMLDELRDIMEGNV